MPKTSAEEGNFKVRWRRKRRKQEERKARSERRKKQIMTAGPLVVLEMPLVAHHLVPTVLGARPKKDRSLVFSSTTNALAAN